MKTIARVASIPVTALLALTLAACGGSGGGVGSKPPDYARALDGAPKPLAALYRQADQLLPGGAPAFQRRLTELRGHPVVVNKWASWCGPCREEMPWFQVLSARLGKRIAFVGVDAKDSDAAAKTFLEEFPLPYPSYTDPGQEISQLIRATIGFPSTAIYDSRGNLAHVQQGQYASKEALAGDIARYAR
jgi:cytochrome c biogenesis protein CcmG/thiol:disulfide interchange protein DsbE